MTTVLVRRRAPFTPSEGPAITPARVRFRMSELGAALKRARLERGMSLADLSARARVSPGLLSQAERGRGNPSFTTLLKLSNALGIRVADLFQGPERANPHRGVVRKNERRVLQLKHEGVAMEILTPEHERSLRMYVSTLPAGFDNREAPHAGLGKTIIHVLRGRLVFSTDGQEFPLQPGDSITFDDHDDFSYRNPGRGACTFMLVSAAT